MVFCFLWFPSGPSAKVTTYHYLHIEVGKNAASVPLHLPRKQYNSTYPSHKGLKSNLCLSFIKHFLTRLQGARKKKKKTNKILNNKPNKI